MTIKEAATTLGVTAATIRHYAHRGRIHIVNPGRKPILVEKRSVMDLKFAVKRSNRGWIPQADAIESEWREVSRRSEEVRELSQRIAHLEKLLGAREPTEELTKPYWKSLMESAVYRMASDEPITADERERWTNAIMAFDDSAMCICANDRDLSALPELLLRFAHRMHQSADQSLEKLHIMNAARQLRYILRVMDPPRPVLRFRFALYENLSAVDSMIIGSCLRKGRKKPA